MKQRQYRKLCESCALESDAESSENESIDRARGSALRHVIVCGI